MKTIFPGIKVTSLDQLYKCEFVFVHGKLYHRGWFMSWQFRALANYVARGVVYEGIKITKDNKGDTN